MKTKIESIVAGICAVIILLALMVGLLYSLPPTPSATRIVTIDPTISVGSNIVTFDINLIEPSNTIQIAYATDTATMAFLHSQGKVLITIPQVNGNGSTTEEDTNPGASVFSSWTTTLPTTYPSGTYTYNFVFLWTQSGVSTDAIATGTFTVQ